ncbi:MAG: hypothetical protein ACC628_16085 [Pirellulaceae bacterium]
MEYLRPVARWLLSLLAVVLLVPTTVSAERPPAHQLLPENTLAYVRIVNVPELRERYRETAIGRIGGDERVKPILSHLYGSLATAYQQIEERVGVPLDALLSIFQGEACVAIVAPEEGRPNLIALVDVGDRLPEARILLKRGQEEIVAQGGTRTEERLGDVTMTVLDPPGSRQRLTLLEKESTIVIGSDTELVKQLLKVWNGDDRVTTLSDNRHFTSIMNQCGGNRAEPPHALFYANPLELIRKSGGGSSAIALATITAMGLDGIQAVGGAMTVAVDEFDGIADAHILLEPPHEGVVKMIAIESGGTSPEPWVPRDSASYITVNWNIQQTYAELVRLVELFRGEGSWDRDIANRISDRLEVDFEKDLIDNLEGRLTHVAWIVKPPRLNSQCTLIGVKLNDPAAGQRTLDKIMGHFPQRFKQETFGGVVTYQLEAKTPRRNFDEETMRLPEPCFGVIGDYLLFSDSVKCLQQAIVTKSDSSQSLANELDYKLIASKISRHLGDSKAGMIIFSRPEESLRHMYMLATSSTMRSRLRDGAEGNPLLKALDAALEDNPLPPFSVLAQYMAPSGAVVTSDETGLHYTAFTLRRE